MRIIIVGAGPAGAALSLLLVRNGLEVVLVERERDAARVYWSSDIGHRPHPA